jgi:hypothetical protein
MVNLGKEVILFGSSKCPACVTQIKILSAYYQNKSGQEVSIKYYDLNVHEAPAFLLDEEGSYSMPTWYFPKSKKLVKGIISIKVFEMNITKNTKTTKNTRFGENNSTPQIDVLGKYGKNFENGKGFQVGKSFQNEITDTWKDPLTSGTVGREFGPGKTDEIYKNGYYNNIRMFRPGDDAESAYLLNRNCNLVNNPESASKRLGIVFDSDNRQIDSNNFGRRRLRSRFGNLYSQMGPAFEKNNQYLISKNTGEKLYGGGLQYEKEKPLSILNKNIFLGTQQAYTPLKKGNLMIPPYVNEFGRKRKSTKKIKEGDVISLKNNKIVLLK